MLIKIRAIQTGAVSIKEAQRVSTGNNSERLRKLFFSDEWTPYLPIYAWLIEHPAGLILVDTGETANVMHGGHFPFWQPYYRNVRMNVTPTDEVGPQLRQMGYDSHDVRYVVLTHMHTDHAGGLSHFPNAQIIMSRTEYQAARGFGGRLAGYLPQHWPEWFAPTLIDFEKRTLAGFAHSYKLLDGIELLPTPGHAIGHLSVFVETTPQSTLLAGDVSYTEQHLLDQVYGFAVDEGLMRETLRRTADTIAQMNALYLPTHDPEAATRLERALIS